MQARSRLCWYEGRLRPLGEIQLASLPLAGLLYGASVFTTLRVYGGHLDHPQTHWLAHCDRIADSLQTFGWPQPDWAQLYQGCIALLIHFDVLRMAVFPDGQVLVTGRSLPPDLAVAQQQGVVAWVADQLAYRRSLPTHKTGNYLDCWLALQAAQRQGAREAILVNDRQHWLETSTGNLWGWKDGHWWTPALSAGILPGIMRQQILNGLSRLQQPIKQIDWATELISQFEALAYSNCVNEILPIRTVLCQSTKLGYDPNHSGFEALREAQLPNPRF
ncbi:MAG: aminotransferase class IV, partial [Cyanobacteria bacterium P01_A01_bin.114]